MNYLEIESVVGREILDSRGNPTVEAEITLFLAALLEAVPVAGSLVPGSTIILALSALALLGDAPPDEHNAVLRAYSPIP